MSGMLIMLVYVHSFHKNRFTIDTKLVIFHLYSTESYFGTCGFYNFPILRFSETKDKGVQIGSFGCPLFGRTDSVFIEYDFSLFG